MKNKNIVALLQLPNSHPAWVTAMAPNLGPPDVLGLQLREILASKSGGEDFWAL